MENIIIIGGGPAGISAALYAARSGRDPLVIEHGAGGLKKAEKIENYYGGGTLSGQELYDKGIGQAKALGVRILTAQVVGVEGFVHLYSPHRSGRFRYESRDPGDRDQPEGSGHRRA